MNLSLDLLIFALSRLCHTVIVHPGEERFFALYPCEQCMGVLPWPASLERFCSYLFCFVLFLRKVLFYLKDYSQNTVSIDSLSVLELNLFILLSPFHFAK